MTQHLDPRAILDTYRSLLGLNDPTAILLIARHMNSMPLVLQKEFARFVGQLFAHSL